MNCLSAEIAYLLSVWQSDEVSGAIGGSSSALGARGSHRLAHDRFYVCLPGTAEPLPQRPFWRYLARSRIYRDRHSCGTNHQAFLANAAAVSSIKLMMTLQSSLVV